MSSPEHQSRNGTLRRTAVVRFGCIVSLVFGPCVAGAGDPPCYYDVTVLDLIPDCGFGGDPGGTTPLAIADNGWITGRHPQCNGTGQPWVLLNTGGTAVQELIPPFEDVYRAEGNDITSTGLIVGTVDLTGVNTRGFIYDHGTGQWELVAPDPANTFLELVAVNKSGVAVGATGNHITGPSPLAVVYNDGQLVDLNALIGSSSSRARDINEHGAITGWSGLAPSIDARAFIYETDGALTSLPPVPGGYTSEGVAINLSGDAAGIGRIPQPDGTGFHRRGFLWANCQMFDLGVLPNLEQTIVRDMNNLREIVGYCAPEAGGGNRAFYWRNGELVALDDLVDPALNLEFSIANSINNKGQIVAVATDGSFPISFAVVLTPSNPGDLNSDCVTNIWDLVILLTEWGGSESLADFDGNGFVDVSDLLFLLSNWG